MPAVSVIMVFHRVGPFMAEAVRSVLTQTFQDLELILVDNGTGAGPEALSGGAYDARVRFVRLPTNEGIPAGHNAGIAAARGEFVVLLDYDDVALPTRIERQVGALRSDSRLGLVSALAERIDEHGRVLEREFSLVEPEAQREYTRYAAPVVTPAYAGRREVFAALPYRAEFPLAADLDFLARAAERWTMRAVPEVLLRYRWHASQTTQARAAEIERTLCAIRLLTARRRAGREEDLASLGNWLASPVQTLAESCRVCAERCVAERFAVLAAYHARRMFVLERSASMLARSLRLAAKSVAMADGSEKRAALRMYLTGPVKALGLRPA